MTEILLRDALTEIDAVVASNPKVIIEFGASWCGPCRAFLPHFTKFAAKHEDFACVKVDIDVDPSVVSTFGIQSVPQVAYFEDGVYVKHLSGRTVIQLEKELAL